MRNSLGFKWTWLSHVVENATPLYGGSGALKIAPDKSILSGDSCNTTVLTMPSHASTHVDGPYHFLINGKSVDEYLPEDWVFSCPHVTFFSASPGQLIVPKNLPLLENINKDTDLLLLCSGFEKHRGLALYWQEGPGLSPEVADYFVEHFPKLRAVGMDFISLSSLKHRDEGRVAHRAFLGRGILLFEDMSLKIIAPDKRLELVIALPLRFARADGAPVAIIGLVTD